MNQPREAFPEALLSTVAAGVDACDAADWTLLNQRWLARRFAGLCQRLSPMPNNAIDIEASHDEGFESAHQRLQRLFGLSPFEGELLLLAAGAECDSPLRDALAELDGAAAPPGVNFAIALTHLDGGHWDALSPLAPLRRWHLLRVVGEASLGQSRLRIDERVLHQLTGVAAFDPRLQGVARLLSAGDEADEMPQGQANFDAVLSDALEGIERPLLLLGAAPPQATARRGAREAVLHALGRLGLRALWVDGGAIDAEPRACAELATAIDREALLADAVIVLAGAPQGHDAAAGSEAGSTVMRLLTQLQGPVLLLGPISATELSDLPERRCLRCPPPAPVATSAATEAAAQEPALRAALQQFQVDDDALQQALAGLPAAPAARGQALWQHLRAASRGGLDGVAVRIESKATLADLVLPAVALDTLRDITLQLRHRAQVHDDWGFAARRMRRGLGVSGAVRRRQRHRQDHGRRGDRQRARPRPLPHRPVGGGQQVHRRDREEPAPALRRRRGQRRRPALRRGRRALRQAQRGQGQPRPLRQHRGQLPAAAHGGLPRPGHPDHQHEERARHAPSCAACASSSTSPSPTRPPARPCGIASSRHRHPWTATSTGQR